VAELSQKERLQPSLLDRLVDNAPDNLQESREHRVLSLDRLRESVLRDLAWLLNTTQFETSQSLENYPYVQHAVLNYGIVDLVGKTGSGANKQFIQNQIRQALLDFEPRILADSLRVNVLVADNQMNNNAITFEIEGDLWSQPLPLRLYLKTELDLETGSMEITDKAA
jgi:type VI secretion system protein ImpF